MLNFDFRDKFYYVVFSIIDLTELLYPCFEFEQYSPERDCDSNLVWFFGNLFILKKVFYCQSGLFVDSVFVLEILSICCFLVVNFYSFIFNFIILSWKLRFSGFFIFIFCWECYVYVNIMVVLESSEDSERAPEPTAAAAPQTVIVPQPPGHRSTMKLLPKRFIGVHQWLSPIAAKQLKEAVVRVFWFYVTIIFFSLGIYFSIRKFFPFVKKKEWKKYLRNFHFIKMYSAVLLQQKALYTNLLINFVWKLKTYKNDLY